MKRITGLILVVFLVLSFNAFLASAQTTATAPTFELKAKYSYIRSYPEGGGIFIIYIEPDDSFKGKVFVNMVAPNALNAQLSKEVLDRGSLVTEITVNPKEKAPAKIYNIRLVALNVEGMQVKTVQKIQLEVEVFQWEAGKNPNLDAKRDLFIEWLEQEHQEFGIFLGRSYDYYCTYPEILIVEHGTYLHPEWEIRVCDHVMVPPYDWSMLCIRKRGALEPLLAAKRESDNTIHEIPVSEYPTFFGY